MIPREILFAAMPAEKELLECWLSGLRGSSVNLNVPARGEKRALMDVVRKDAQVMLKDIDERAHRQMEKDEALRRQLVSVFGEDLGSRMRRVESYDISHLMGMDSVGAMVVFEDGRPLKKAYRRFKIKTVGGADDTGSMIEVLFRRFRKAVENDPAFSRLPDVILMDGGIGQVNAAKSVLAALRLDIPVAGMVKDDKHRTRAILFEGKETSLKGMQELFAYCGRIQEEVHRFAIEYHRSLRGKSMSRSVLDGIPGIGEKRKLSLLEHFGSVDAIKVYYINAE